MNFYFRPLYRLFFLTLVLASFSISYAFADIRIGWNSQADLEKFDQLQKKSQEIGGEPVIWTHYDDDYKALHDLAINKVDVVPVDMVSFLSVVTVGLQVRAIAIHQEYGRETGLFVRNQSHIDHPQDLVGKKIAVPFMTSNQYSLLRALQHWQISLDKVQIVNMKPQDILNAWQQGTIDGAYIDGVTAIQLAGKDSHMLVSSQQLAEWGYPTYQFWVVMDESIANNPALMQAVVNRHLMNVKRFNQDVTKMTAQDPDIIKIAHLLNLSPEMVVSLYKNEHFLPQPQQSLIMSRFLLKEMNHVALFLRGHRVIDTIQGDYLLYLYDSFVMDAKIH